MSVKQKMPWTFQHKSWPLCFVRDKKIDFQKLFPKRDINFFVKITYIIKGSTVISGRLRFVFRWNPETPAVLQKQIHKMEIEEILYLILPQ